MSDNRSKFVKLAKLESYATMSRKVSLSMFDPELASRFREHLAKCHEIVDALADAAMAEAKGARRC